jgi:hypothetical protein
MIAFTAITAVAAWAGVHVASGQLQAMKDAAPDTANLVKANRDMASAAKTQAENTGKLVDAANKSAAAAQDAASAARDSLNLSRQNTVRQFGAKLEIGLPRLTKTGVGEKPHVEIPVSSDSGVNNGFWISGIVALPLGTNAIQTPSCADIAKRPDATNWYLVNGTAMEKDATFALTQPQIDELKTSKLAIYFIARICYADGFGHTPHRDICTFWTGENWTTINTFCQEGNGSGQ